MTTSIMNEYTSLYKSVTLYFRKGDFLCVWEMSGDKDGRLYWPKLFLDHSSTSFASWLGLLKLGSLRAQSPLSGAGSHFGILSNWLEPPRSLVILFSTVHLLPLLFRLFKQVHLLIDGSVEGQYITFRILIFKGSVKKFVQHSLVYIRLSFIDSIVKISTWLVDVILLYSAPRWSILELF